MGRDLQTLLTETLKKTRELEQKIQKLRNEELTVRSLLQRIMKKHVHENVNHLSRRIEKILRD